MCVQFVCYHYHYHCFQCKSSLRNQETERLFEQKSMLLSAKLMSNCACVSNYVVTVKRHGKVWVCNQIKSAVFFHIQMVHEICSLQDGAYLLTPTVG